MSPSRWSPRPGRGAYLWLASQARAYATGSPFGSPSSPDKSLIGLLPGAPGRIRTRDPLLRRQLLYPAELQAPTERIVQDPGHVQATSPGYSRLPGGRGGLREADGVRMSVSRHHDVTGLT